MHMYPRLDAWKRPRALERIVLPGWLPAEPPIRKGDRVLAVGSCFARQIARYLWSRGMGSGHVGLFVHDGRLVTTHAMLRHFEWALRLRDIEPDETIWVENKATMGVTRVAGQGGRTRRRRVCMPIDLDEEARRKTGEVIRRSDAFVFTFGLSEGWFDRKTGEVFIKAVPRLRFDSKRHEHRVTTVDENRGNIERLIQVVRDVHPTAPIVMTLSPQPLVATWRDVSCATANCVSKSILRVAIDEVYRASDDPNLYYWPSYEMVTLYWGKHAHRGDGRHIHADVSNEVVRLFCKYFVREKLEKVR